MKKIIMKLLVAATVLLVLLVIIGVAALWQLDRVVKTTVETIGPKALGAPVTLEEVNVSIFSGEGALSGLRVGNPEGFKTDTALELERLHIEIDMSTLRSDVIHVSNVIIEAPTITFEGLQGGNMKQIQRNVTAFASTYGNEEKNSDKKREDKGNQKKVVIDRLVLTGGRLNYAPVMGKTIPIPLPEIEMKGVGEASGGATIASVLGQILLQIDDAAIGAIGAIGGSTEIVEEVLEDAVDAVDSAVEKVGGFLKGLTGGNDHGTPSE